jgi:hypothetical protein
MMGTAITLGGVLLFLAIVNGLGAMLVGAVMILAAANMPTGDDGTGAKGCIVALVGLALTLAAILKLVL